MQHRFLLTNKIKEISFKLTHNIYPIKNFLKKNLDLILIQIALSVRMTLKLFFTYFGHAILLGNFGKMLMSPWIPKPLF